MGKPWLKLWTETLHDRKLRRIPPEQRWCWIGLLMLAASGPDNGRLEVAAGEPMTDADIVDALAVAPETWQAARDYFTRLGMMTLDGATLTLTNYAKRQAPKDSTAADRMKAWRERNKTVTVTPVTRNVTRNATRKLRVEAEAETEEEAETTTAVAHPRPNIFGLYESYIGMVDSPGLAAILKDAELLYPDYWLEPAFKIAAGMNKRNWKYTEGVLRKWQIGEYPPPILNADGSVTMPDRDNGNGRAAVQTAPPLPAQENPE